MADLSEPSVLPEPSVVRMRRRGGAVVRGATALYIGRRCSMGGWSLPDSEWRNPFSVAECGSVRAACARFAGYLRRDRPDLLLRLGELSGRELGCFCYDSADRASKVCECGAPATTCRHPQCHGDVLVAAWREWRDARAPRPEPEAPRACTIELPPDAAEALAELLAELELKLEPLAEPEG